MAMVSPSEASLRGGVTTTPQELQKRLVSEIAAEQDGHLVMAWASQNRNTSFPFTNSALQVPVRNAWAFKRLKWHPACPEDIKRVTMTCVTKDALHSQQEEAAKLRILVGDDQLDVLEALRLLLKGAGYQSVLVDSPQAVLRAARADSFDLILMDLNYARDTTSGAEGLDLLSSLEAQDNAAPVIVMTAWGNVELAVEAMRRGACDFVQKPWDNARLLGTIRKQAEAASERAKTKRRVASELEIARNVQQKLFPHQSRRLATIDYAGQCVPAREVSGDYYDFLDVSENGLGFVLADVSGKGVAAALLMANLQACFRSQSREALVHPASMLRAVNKLFYESTSPEHFATLFFAVYDDRNRRLCYVNCGHLPPFLNRANGTLERLQPTATVLGVFSNWTCEEQTVDLHPGDTLVLFTDGVTEAGVENDQEFGEDGLLATIQANQGKNAEALVNEIISAVEGETLDDVTVVAIRAV
jgi:sigma-B regulation protein RsbU (phosphoserine phosphatase)